MLCRSVLPSEESEFCCSGCRHVFNVIQSLDPASAERYLQAAIRLGIIPEGDRTPSPSPEQSSPVSLEAIRDVKMIAGGMICPSCAWIIDQILLSHVGVIGSETDFFSSQVHISFDLRVVSPEDLKSFLSPFGYTISEFENTIRKKAAGSLTFRFIVSAILTMNLMSLSFLRYSEYLGFLDKAPVFLIWAEFLLCIPVMILGWLPIMRRGMRSILQQIVTADLFIGLAALAAFLLSFFALIHGKPDIYFETAAGLIVISLLSRTIEARLRDRAFADLSLILQGCNNKVRKILKPKQEVFVTAGSLSKNDVIAVKEGEMICCDCISEGSECLVNEAMLTGEPLPVRKVRGDKICAGSILIAGALIGKISSRFEESRLHSIAIKLQFALIESESRLRSADRISRWFTPIVMGLVIGVWILRAGVYGWGYALGFDGWFPSVAALAVACPCAFSIAGIIAITASASALLKYGILVKDMVQLENMHQIDTVIFDKTGTLTSAKMQVSEIVWDSEPQPGLFPYVAAIEAYSVHPVASAIRAYLFDQGITDHSPIDLIIEDMSGVGLRMNANGRYFSIGARSLFDKTPALQKSEIAHSAVYFGFDRLAAGCFLLTDELKSDAPELVRRIKAMNLRTVLLSGDRRSVCEDIGKKLNIDEIISDASIDDKTRIINDLKKRSRAIAYIGDGTNDALAMSRSQASIALAKSTDETLAASGFIILTPHLTAISGLLNTGKILHRIISINYIWAFLFNIIFIPVALAGYLTPIASMLLMLVSSCFILLNSIRLKHRKPSA